MTVWFASGNTHKKKELKDILSSTASPLNANAFELMIPSDAGLDFEPEETGATFLENALIKAAELYRFFKEKRVSMFADGDSIIADDSGLCVDALQGRPGIHSARYGGKSLGASEKNALLLSELGDNSLRSGRFICAMVLYYGPYRYFAAQETLEVELIKNIESAKGKGGFGYDPISYIPALGRTVAELSGEEKNLISHRGKAGRAIARILGMQQKEH